MISKFGATNRIFNLLSYGTFAKQKEHNRNLKDNSTELSQISSNETSLNSDIIEQLK